MSPTKKHGLETLREMKAVLAPEAPKHLTAGRLLENIAFGIGVAFAAALGVIELLDRAGFLANARHGFPLVSILILTLLVAPKMLGRATAGSVWTALASRIGKKEATP